MGHDINLRGCEIISGTLSAIRAPGCNFTGHTCTPKTREVIKVFLLHVNKSMFFPVWFTHCVKKLKCNVLLVEPHISTTSVKNESLLSKCASHDGLFSNIWISCEISCPQLIRRCLGGSRRDPFVRTDSDSQWDNCNRVKRTCRGVELRLHDMVQRGYWDVIHF